MNKSPAATLGLVALMLGSFPLASHSVVLTTTTATIQISSGVLSTSFVSQGEVLNQVTQSADVTGTNFKVNGITIAGVNSAIQGAVYMSARSGAVAVTPATVPGGSVIINNQQFNMSALTSITSPYIVACWQIETFGPPNADQFVCSPAVANTNGSGGSGGTEESTPAPAKYSGPEFSGLSGMGIMTGSTGKLEGKRLDQISSIEIGGKAATFTATSATELDLSLPAGLAPGLYDLVINSSAGKLTHINAIQVREPKQSFSITSRSTGKISEEQYLEHSLIAAMQAPELNKARCIVNASTQAMAEAMAKRLCAIVKASNPNIETTVVVPRSTVRNDTVFARVIYGWN